MIRFLLIAFWLLLSIMTLSSQSDSTRWEKLENDTFSLLYPSDWDLDQSGTMGSLAIVFSPLTSESDDFKENVNVMIQDLRGKGITFETYIDISKSQISTMMNEGKLLSTDTDERDGHLIFKMSYSGRQGIYNLIFHAVVYMRDEVYYLMTFTAEKEEFDLFQEYGMKVVESFILK